MLKYFTRNCCACCCNTPDRQHRNSGARRGCGYRLYHAVAAPGEVPALIRSLFHSLWNGTGWQEFCFSFRFRATSEFRTLCRAAHQFVHNLGRAMDLGRRRKTTSPLWLSTFTVAQLSTLSLRLVCSSLVPLSWPSVGMHFCSKPAEDCLVCLKFPAFASGR